MLDLTHTILEIMTAVQTLLHCGTDRCPDERVASSATVQLRSLKKGHLLRPQPKEEWRFIECVHRTPPSADLQNTKRDTRRDLRIVGKYQEQIFSHKDCQRLYL